MLLPPVIAHRDRRGPVCLIYLSASLPIHRIRFAMEFLVLDNEQALIHVIFTLCWLNGWLHTPVLLLNRHPGGLESSPHKCHHLIISHQKLFIKKQNMIIRGTNLGMKHYNCGKLMDFDNHDNGLMMYWVHRKKDK